MKNALKLSLAAPLALVLTACGKASEAPSASAPESSQEMNMDMSSPQASSSQADMNVPAGILDQASYDLVNAGGYKIGTVLIRDTATGVTISLDATSLPEGERAIHIHETGSCDGPDFTSAGGHYNPNGMNHGKMAEGGPHAGDLPNINVPASGVLQTALDSSRVSLSDRQDFAPLRDANGSAIIIHAGADDYKTQPTGAAGGRIACAVID